ncbi:MAG: ChbG/HpnK family deacetylase [Bacteroidota bacterium]
MKIYLHADDYGLTKKITDDILECIDAGVINSISIMANGYAFDYSVQELLKRKEKNINLVLHLNLDQGCALADSKLLTNNKGQLDKGFEGIFWRNLLLCDSERNKLRSEIYNEMEQQIIKVLPLFESLRRPLKLDGERCTHLVPIVFDSILKLSKKYPTKSIRIVRESWLFILSRYPQCFLSAGILKLLILRIFSFTGKYENKLRDQKISFSDYTFSTVKSGELTQSFIEHFLIYIRNEKNLEVEVVFHPFKPLVQELFLWTDRYIYRNHFASSKRGKEKSELLTHQKYFSSLGKKQYDKVKAHLL